MKDDLLPSWTALERAYKARSARALTGVLLRAASAKQVQMLEQAIATHLPSQLKAWFEAHAGTSRPLLFGDSAVPLWRMLPPSECLAHWRAVAEPSWLPFAICESGSVQWFLAMQLRGTQSETSEILFVDSDRPTEPRKEAASLDELFARELARVERGDLVVVGFEDGSVQLMSRESFAQLSEAEGASLLPRARREREPRPAIAPDEEGRRFLALLVESRLIRIDARADIAELAPAVSKVLHRRTADRAEQLVALLERANGVELGPLRAARVRELLARW